MPAKKTRAKKAQAKKKQAKDMEMPSPNTPPASGRSPFTKLPLEIHMLIGDMLKEKKQLGGLARGCLIERSEMEAKERLKWLGDLNCLVSLQTIGAK
ncbi:hypothetical protein QBC45DRAFT_398098 [Copromyces sp. CBS 386.78]|nr:hypothetical protein QBC45DRAFT_398098 [Copromyces sp. CBS 386.78]